MFQRTSRPVAAGIGVFTIAATLLAGCSSQKDEPAPPPESSATEPAADVEVGTNTELAARLVAQPDLPPDAQVRPLDKETIVNYVTGRKNLREAEHIFGDPCDLTLKGEYPADRLIADSVITEVAYPGEQPHSILVILAPGRMDHFMSREAFSCESPEIDSQDAPNLPPGEAAKVKMVIGNEDAPPVEGVEGVEGFREIRDIISTSGDKYVLERNIVLHGFAGDTTFDVSYKAITDTPDVDPISEDALAQLDATYVAQARKLAGGQ